MYPYISLHLFNKRIYVKFIVNKLYLTVIYFKVLITAY